MTIGRRRRIVSQGSHADEYLYAVVPLERVVGVSETAYEPRLSNVYAHVQRYRPIVASDPERVLLANRLATAGVLMQSLFRNPLAEPSLIGVGPGAVLGAVDVFVTGWSAASAVTLPLIAIASAFASLFLVYGASTRGGSAPTTTLLLTGLAVGAFLAAISSLLLSLNVVTWQVAQEIVFWMMGGLDSRTWAHVWLSVPFVRSGCSRRSCSRPRSISCCWAKRPRVAWRRGRGRETASRVHVGPADRRIGGGGRPHRLRRPVVPHAVRLLLGPGHRRLLPASAVAGSAFVVACDLVARTARPPAEIRLGVVTALCGAPSSWC